MDQSKCKTHDYVPKWDHIYVYLMEMDSKYYMY